MRVRAAWFGFELPLARPWASAGGVVSTRRGRLLRLTDENGLVGWGESSPWPEIGISLPQADAHAEDCAELDLAAQAARLPLADFLAGRPVAHRLRINAALGPLANATLADVDRALDAGFRILKFKLGVARPAQELKRLEDIAGRLGHSASLRLDANRAWSPAQAREFITACAGMPIESLEEPLCHPGCGLLGEMQALAHFPLALDESIALADDAFFCHPCVRRLVIKPPRHGGLTPALALIRRAQAAGLSCVVTSSIDSACALLAAAHLAAAALPLETHGLDTADWLRVNTGAWPGVREGELALPGEFGLGFIAQGNLTGA